MRASSLLHRRPSASLIVASLALFVSLGGAGYAATQLPNGSVGAAQLRNGSVTYKKIQFGAVGYRRVNQSQVQIRVSGTCPSTNAVGAIDSVGKVTCNPTLPKEYGSTSTVTVPAAALTSVGSESLPAGSFYLASANPTATLTSTNPGQQVDVKCTLTVGPNTQTRSASIISGPVGSQSSESIPLTVAGPSGTAGVACQTSSPSTPTPAVSVTSAISALQTQSNN